MPPAGAQARGELRATVGRLAHERFTDERVGELLADARRRATSSRPTSCASPGATSTRRARVPGELVAEMARAGVAARGAWLQARESSDFAPFAPYLERNIELRRRYSACFPEADHPYDPLLDDYEPGMRTADLRDVLRAPARRPRPARGRGAPGRRRRAARGPFPEAGQRALVDTVLRAIGVDERAVAPRRGRPIPFEATIAATRRAPDHALRRGRPRLALRLAARVRPRALRAPDRPRPRAHAAGRRRLERLARVAEPAVGEHGRALGAASGAGACRTRRRRCPSASRGVTLAGGPAARPTRCARASSA